MDSPRISGRPMRRKDRQITDTNEIIEIISKCDVCRLAMVDDGKPYLVPMSFGYEHYGVALTLYFHCARTGRKIDILQRNPLICFEMDRGKTLVKGTRACDYSYYYESVIGSGNVEFVEDVDEKNKALKKIMAQYAGSEDFSFTPEETARVCVFKIQTDDFTAKRSGKKDD